MNWLAPVYIYESNLIVEFLLPLFLFISIRKPIYFSSLIAAIAFLRPNERFDLFVPYSYYIFVLSFLVLIFNIKEVRNYKIEWDDKIIILFVLWIILETIAFHPSNFNHNATYCLMNIFKYFILCVFLSNKKGVIILCYFLAISCFLICFEAYFYHFTEPENSPLWQIFHGVTGRIRAWGLWGNANETSFIACIGVASLLLLLLMADKKGLPVLMSIFFIPVHAIVVFLTASRTGLGCFIILFLFLGLRVKSKAVKVFAVVIMIGIIIVAPKLTPEREDKDASSRERASLRSDAIYLFKMNPLFGVGFLRAQNETGGMAIHNTYLQAFAETGIVGGGLLMFYLFSFFKKFYKLFKLKTNDKGISNINGALTGIFICGLLYFLFGNQLLSTMFITFFALIKTTLHHLLNASVTEEMV